MKNKEAKSIFSSLENFSSTPPPELWANIEAELDKPKKKKRPVFWWWAAACLVAGLSLPTIWYMKSNQRGGLDVIIKNNENGVVFQNEPKDNVRSNKNVNERENTTATKSFDEKRKSTKETENQNLNTGETPTSVTNNNLATAKTISVISSTVNNDKVFKSSKEEKNKSLIAENSKKSESDATVINKNTAVSIYNPTSVVGINNFSSKSNSNENAKTIASSQGNAVYESKQNKENLENANSKLAPTNQNSEISNFNTNKTIAQNTSTKDSVIVKKEVAQLENALADLDKNKKKKKTNSEVVDKWSLQVFAGVMGSENYTNEKALGNTVASKQSNGYGIKTNYKLNKKWAVSSGFKINELGQKIDGVSYYDRSGLASSLSSGALPTDAAQSSPLKSNITSVSNNENYMFAENSKASTGFETGNVTQNLRYFEMPFEVSYALLSKKKASISMNTGGFVGKLIANEVLLSGNSIGENKNVNEFVYGTLLSSTLQYEVYKKTKFFIEPGMNYYVNPLENQSFNQFQWMFNVGLNISF